MQILSPVRYISMAARLVSVPSGVAINTMGWVIFVIARIAIRRYSDSDFVVSSAVIVL